MTGSALFSLDRDSYFAWPAMLEARFRRGPNISRLTIWTTGPAVPAMDLRAKPKLAWQGLQPACDSAADQRLCLSVLISCQIGETGSCIRFQLQANSQGCSVRKRLEKLLQH